MTNKTFEQKDLECKSQQKRPLNILMLCWEFPPNIVGGLSRHVFGLSTHLADQGHNVYCLTAGNSKLPSFERMSGVNVYRVRPINEQDDQFLSWIAGLNLAMAIQAEQLSEDIQFNLLHAHDWLVGAASIALKESLRVPLLTTIHATEHGRNNGIHTEIQQFIHDKEQQLISDSDQIIVCSDYMKNELMSIFHAKDDEIAIIANGIDNLNVEQNFKPCFPEITQKKYIFSIGRIVREKGFETILEAAALAKEMEMNCFFVVAGKGPMLETYKQQIREKKLDKYVAFIGYITDEQRNALINGSEITVIPSLYEPFGIVALETMMLGKPTIVSNTGGMKGIVKHLQTGMLMVPGDAKSLLEQVHFLMNNPEKAEEIGEKGRQIVKSMYSWKRIAFETIRVMEDTLLNTRVNENVQNVTPTNKSYVKKV
ncbi:glycosyltransferase family 4 protein [Neobacillus sp. 19]|uniref:glycosyltransferase family 4 protein n=1 Tax=Neobacillus sp. 19 TaxID=3394458 RepID=UPI003BF6E1AA